MRAEFIKNVHLMLSAVLRSFNVPPVWKTQKREKNKKINKLEKNMFIYNSWDFSNLFLIIIPKNPRFCHLTSIKCLKNKKSGHREEKDTAILLLLLNISSLSSSSWRHRRRRHRVCVYVFAYYPKEFYLFIQVGMGLINRK